MIVGYARVSTGHQSLDQQRDALEAAGCERVFADELSGVRDDRPGLAQLLEVTRAGDVVIVTALDRLGRPARLTAAQARQLRDLRDGGEPIAELARTFKVSRATVYRVLERAATST